MAKKTKTQFVCQNCGAELPKWQGQCPQCKEWNTLVEETVEPQGGGAGLGGGLGRAGGGFGAGPGARQQAAFDQGQLAKMTTNLSEIEAVRASKKRFSTTIKELDRVLGGGLVPGSVSLIGGEPGIGKSTLLTQLSLGLLLAERYQQGQRHKQQQQPEKQKQRQQAEAQQETFGFGSVLYVCGEESPSQISMRIGRILENEQFLLDLSFGKDLVKVLGQKQSVELKQQISQNLQFVTSTDVDQLIALIASQAAQAKPQVVIVDSIQTLVTQDLSGASGSIGQVRECTQRLVRLAKQLNIAMFLVGHITKEGSIAGPKVLEHIVDSVLELKGERTGQFRMLRALKNRFGATDEVGVFRLADYGLQQVDNPSQLFIDNQQDQVPGSAISCLMEGTRPLLIEVQALVNRTQLAMPRRVGRGIDVSRIQILSAVLQKHSKLSLSDYDIFLSAAGGFTVKEPAIDLGLAMAIVSSLKNKTLPKKTVFVGEIGLLGEVRPVPYLERRIKEAKRLGFEHIISSKSADNIKYLIRLVAK
jgi:DNA repair protein RadA/Sms